MRGHNHLGRRISALVDGELGHADRERALAHVAHCPSCRMALEQERAVKARVADAAVPAPSLDLTRRLLVLGEPGDPLPPRTPSMPLAPLVPTLPAPGRARRSGAPGGRRDARRPAARGRVNRVRYAAAGVLSVAGLVLGTAFVAGGSPQQPGAPVLPPSAELSVEHAATSSGLPLRDPAFDAVTASFGGLTFPASPGR
ncbi:MAG: hypothetical protein QOJ90_1295 [Actinomycetota bacterium]|nr:hypothetical protein [Actinomycetota bacterium]